MRKLSFEIDYGVTLLDGEEVETLPIFNSNCPAYMGDPADHRPCMRVNLKSKEVSFCSYFDGMEKDGPAILLRCSFM